MSEKPETLSQRAVAVMSARPSYPPNGNTGGISRHSIVHNGKNARTSKPEASKPSTDLPQNTPPLGRASRAKRTTSRMADFLGLWFLDWLTLTVPNPETGKGTRSPGDAGERMVAEAEKRLALWSVTQSLWTIRVGNGSDGFKAGAHMGLTPHDKDRVATIRTGHASNMPSLEIPGGDGACARLAPSALRLLGPAMVARADVSLDWSQPGLWDDLLAYAQAQTGTGAGAGMKAPMVTTSGCGRTFTWGSKKGSGVSVKVYEKDLERVAKGKLDIAQADPDLVRIEFTFRPETKKKAAFAKLSPAQMLCTSRWVRRMVETVGRMVRFTEKGDTMAEQKVTDMPDPTTIKERAEHVIRQAARTTVMAAAAEMVARDFAGDWSAAEIDPAALHEAATDMIAQELARLGTAHDFVMRNGLEGVRTHEQRAVRMLEELRGYIDQQSKETAESQARLTDALADIQRGSGVGSSSSNVVPFSGSGIDGAAADDLRENSAAVRLDTGVAVA